MGTLFSKEVGIHEAIKSNDYNKVEYLIIKHPKMVNERLPNLVGMTPLMEAARRGNYKIVELLIDKGGKAINVNEKDLGPEKTAYGSQKTALDFAIETKSWSVVALLILKGAHYHDELNHAIVTNDWDIADNLTKNGATLQSIVLSEKINTARKAGYNELAKLLLKQNRALQESNVPLSVRELETRVDEVKSELDGHKQKQNALEESFTQSEKENTKRFEKFQQLIDEVKQSLVMDKDYIVRLDDYERAVYLHLKWSLNSIYIAAFSCGNEEGISESHKTGNIGKAGGVAETLGSITPSYIGSIIQKFGEILICIDNKNQSKMVKNFAKLADSVRSMEKLIEIIAKKTVSIVQDLDIEKIEKDMESFLNSFVDLLSRISEVFAKYYEKPLAKSAKIAAADIVFSQAQSQIDQYFDNEETVSEATQRGKKHATVILALLTAKIYAWDGGFTEYDSEQINQAILTGFLGNLVEKYQNDIELNQTTEMDTKTVAFAEIIKYDNEILNNPELLQATYKIGGIKLVNKLIDLGQDIEVGEQISQTAKELGAEKVLEIFFGNEVESSKAEIIQTQEQELVIKTQDDQLIESIYKIEATIGKEALNEITGYYRYVSAALSNNPLSISATKVIQIIGNLINNLEEWLDFGIAYESIDIDNQITIILSQLEHWFNFVASGQMHVGLPPRYPGFDPDDDSNGGSGDGDQGLIYGGGVDSNQNEPVVTFFVGQNTTTLDS